MRMNVRLLLCVVVFLTAALTSTAQDLGARHNEPTGGFSFCPPAGWTAREVPGKAYKVFFTTLANGQTPNLTVRDLPYSDTLDDFVSGNLKTLESSGMKDYKFLSKTDITTLSKQRGIKVIIQVEIYRRLLRQTFYSFNLSNSKKLLFTFTVPADGGEAYDNLFDESMKTLQTDINAPRAATSPVDRQQTLHGSI